MQHWSLSEGRSSEDKKSSWYIWEYIIFRQKRAREVAGRQISTTGQEIDSLY